MAERLQVYSVEEASETAAVCIVRCVGGVVRVGQTFAVEGHPLRPGSVGAGPGHIALMALNRYGRSVDFIDPPRAAKVRLSGPGVSLLAPGVALTFVGEPEESPK